MIKRTCFVLLVFMGLSIPAYADTASGPDPKLAGISHDMETQAEELVIALLAKNQANSEHYYKLISANLDKLHKSEANTDFNERRARELIMAYSWMRLISLDMKHSEWIGAAIAANQMRGEIIRFTDFASNTLRDLAWMDYLGRDMMLLSLESRMDNLELIGLRKDALNEIWQHVRIDMIRDFRNKPLVVRGDQLMLQMGAESSTDQLIELTNNELDLVQDLKKALSLESAAPPVSKK